MGNFEIVNIYIEEERNIDYRTYDYKIELSYKLSYMDIHLDSPEKYIHNLLKQINLNDILIEHMTGLS